MTFTKSVSGFVFLLKVLGRLADTIGAIENMMIEIGDKNKLEIFVKYERSGYWPFLMPKSAKNSHFLV